MLPYLYIFIAGLSSGEMISTTTIIINSNKNIISKRRYFIGRDIMKAVHMTRKFWYCKCPSHIRIFYLTSHSL